MPDLDPIWKALSDRTRRGILEHLRVKPLPTTEIVEQFPNLSRFGVMKHLDVLRDAGLIKTEVDGRRRINSLNAIPIQQIRERWINKFEIYWENTMFGIKEDAEAEQKRTK